MLLLQDVEEYWTGAGEIHWDSSFLTGASPAEQRLGGELQRTKGASLPRGIPYVKEHCGQGLSGAVGQSPASSLQCVAERCAVLAYRGSLPDCEPMCCNRITTAYLN